MKTPPQDQLMLRRANSLDDLAVMNTVIQQAVESWPASPRLKRLSLAPLRYRAVDLQDFDFLLCYKAHACLGVAAWQPSVPLVSQQTEVSKNGEVTGNATAVLLHGLYVSAQAQGRGIGGLLLDELTWRARREKFSSIHVRVERFSTGYFEQRGFRLLTHEEEPGFQPTSYPYRYVLDLDPSEERDSIATNKTGALKLSG
jgi:GNAT superfamily N-acetyltransferase